MQRGGEGVHATDWLIYVGTHWTPDDFVEQALQCPHPYAQQARVPDRTLRAIFRVLTTGVKATEERRNSELKRMAELAKVTDGEESDVEKMAMEASAAAAVPAARLRSLADPP